MAVPFSRFRKTNYIVRPVEVVESSLTSLVCVPKVKMVAKIPLSLMHLLLFYRLKLPVKKNFMTNYCAADILEAFWDVIIHFIWYIYIYI